MSTDEQKVPRWQRSLPGAATITTGFTTLCCIGVSAATSLLTTIGLGVLINDKYLAPALVAGITITSVASAFTYQRHHNPLPLLTTILAGTWIYYFTYSDYQKQRVWIGPRYSQAPSSTTSTAPPAPASSRRTIAQSRRRSSLSPRPRAREHGDASACCGPLARPHWQIEEFGRAGIAAGPAARGVWAT